MATGVPVGVATMEKRFTGAIDGRSATLLTAAFDQTTGFGDRRRDGVLRRLRRRRGGHVRLRPLRDDPRQAGISGSGGLAVDADGTHRIWLTYALE